MADINSNFKAFHRLADKQASQLSKDFEVFAYASQYATRRKLKYLRKDVDNGIIALENYISKLNTSLERTALNIKDANKSSDSMGEHAFEDIALITPNELLKRKRKIDRLTLFLESITNALNERSVVDFRLDKNQLTLAKRVFDAYDKDMDGLIDSKDFGACLRAMGVFITDKSVSEVLTNIDPNSTSKIDMGTYFIQLAKLLTDNVNIAKNVKSSLYKIYINPKIAFDEAKIPVETFRSQLSIHDNTLMTEESITELLSYLESDFGNKPIENSMIDVEKLWSSLDLILAEAINRVH